MASHHLTIAKATFAASLLRPDVTKINRDELPNFHQILETVLLNCTPSTIQTCKQWLFDHVIPSAQRSTAFGKYLNSLSKYISKPDVPQNLASVCRQRLHLLYLLNDLFHHAKYHGSATSANKNVSEPFQPFLPDLFRNAASELKKNIHKRLEELVKIWQVEQYVPEELSTQLKAVMADPTLNAATSATQANQKAVSGPKDLPFIMPSTHGDPSLPFYELPAGNFMPHISKISMRTDSTRALQFAPGPADEGLVNAVKDFLKEVERIKNPFVLEDEGIVADLDDLGELTYRNEAGELTGETYYGWSRVFCDKMRARQNPNHHDSGAWSRSWSYSSSRSPNPRRKRRYSHSSSDRSRSRSRRRIRRSSEDQDNDEVTRKGRLRSESPPRFAPATNTNIPMQHLNADQSQYRSSPANPGMPLNPGFHPPPLLPGNLPIPPPRPSNWPAGSPWPPPPPPLIGMGGNMFPQLPFPPRPPGHPNTQGGSSFPYNNGPPSYNRR